MNFLRFLVAWIGSFGMTLAVIIVFMLLIGCASTGGGKTFNARCMGPREVAIELDTRREVRVGCYKDLANYTCRDGPIIAESFAGVWFVRCYWGYTR